MNTSTLTIVGVGLLGGSLALAARKRKLAATVIGVGRNIDRLEPARAKGVIDEVATDLTDAARRSDMMIFCSPVDQIASQVLRAAQNCSPSCLLTDVGSTKRRIVETVEQACGSHTLFVGSHPLAGSEKQGWQFADSDLFVGRTVVITATAHTPRAAAKQATEFWNALGSLVVAKTSHLPHLVAAALATSLCLKSGETKLSANGLRDTTRIASGDPALWTAILWENRQEVARGLESFQDSVNDWRTALNAESPAAIRVLLEQGKQSRDALGN
jgi:prephenate dehydrogenase